MRTNDYFGVKTDLEHLRALRRELINARELLYAVDEGETTDKHFECKLPEGMHPRVRSTLEYLDGAIRQTAYMIDELDT